VKACLIPVGSAAAGGLPTLVSALSCGAAGPLPSLDIFLIGALPEGSPLPSLLADLNVCHSLLSGENSLFPVFFSFSEQKPELPDVRKLADAPSSRVLLSALRGPGLPLSYQTDAEAVQWAFSALLPSWEPLETFLKKIDAYLAAGEEVRLTLEGDLCDAWTAGCVLALLPWLRKRLPGDRVFLSLLAVSDPSGPYRSSRMALLREQMKALLDRSLIRETEGRETFGADALWLVSLPSSLMAETASAHLTHALAARVLSELSARPSRPAPGLHTRSLPPVVTLQSLGKEAVPFAAFLRTAVWCLSDLFPALQAYLEHPTLLRSLAPATRNGLFKRLFRPTENQQPTELSLLIRTLKALLAEVLGVLRAMPEPLRLAEQADARWQKAVEACGRTVTVASEYDVSRAEAEESGVDKVMPVHRASLADTEEEKALRRLDDLADQLSECRKQRGALLAELGGYRAWQCLQDCLAKCLSALEAARKKMTSLTGEAGVDHLTLGLQQRRIRLLEAAVLRCREDLKTAPLPEHLSAPCSVRSADPFAGQLLTPAAAKALLAFLQAEEAEKDPAERALRDQLPSLFAGFSLSDAKGLLRLLLTRCEPAADQPPLVTLFRSAFEAVLEETAGVRLLSAGLAPRMPLLPDLICPEAPATLSGLLGCFPPSPEEHAEEDAAHQRGLLAMLLLRSYRRGSSAEAVLAAEDLRPCGDFLTDAWLEARRASLVSVLSLRLAEVSLPFALVLPGRAWLPARMTGSHAALVPAFATWFDPENCRFTDPCEAMAEGDRLILRDQLARLLASLPDGLPLKGFLADFQERLERVQPVSSEDPLFPQRARAACGLRTLAEYRPFLQRVTVLYEPSLPEDPVASPLAGISIPASHAGPSQEILYLWHGTPFARESETRLLDSPRTALEKHILSTLDAECRVLSRSSDDYRDALVRELRALLQRCPHAEEARKAEALSLIREAEQPLREDATTLSWPWDPASPAVRTLLTECLGTELAPFVTQPFSDRLTLFPARAGEIIGDAMLSRMCVLRSAAPSSAAPPAPQAAASSQSVSFPQAAAEPQPAPAAQEAAAPAPADDAVLPPLSPAFAAALCRSPAGRTLLQPGFLALERIRDQGVRVTLTLEGNYSLRLTRLYPENEILSLYAHDMPTLAVWPSLPFPPDRWKAFYAYAHLPEPFRLEAVPQIPERKPILFERQGPRYVRSMASFPVCFHLYRDEFSAGSLPNLLPEPQTVSRGPVVACVDPGSVGISVIFASRGGRSPLHGQTLVRTLMHHPLSSRDLLRREFLPAVPVSALLPEVVRLFRAGEHPRPFEDGIILMTENLQDLLSLPAAALRDAPSLALHQAMLLTALQAREDGADSLSWRFAVPDGITPEGRNAFVGLCQSLAEQVQAVSGLPAAGEHLVSFASQSAAAGAYFRFVSPEDTRGGFMTLDLGASTADLSLFLRGREAAVRSCSLALGIQYMLLPTLLRDPDLPARDFGFIQEEDFRQDLGQLVQTLRNARTDAAALHLAGQALDAFLADRLPLLVSAALQRRMDQAPSMSGALLLFHFSFLMMLSGLMLQEIAADPARNDFLPDQMSLCLAGRGAAVLEMLSNQTKQALWRFLTMFRNPRVSSLALLFSAEKKMEVSVGLSALQSVSKDVPEAAPAPAGFIIRPEELLPEFLRRFCQEFPMEAMLLFPNFFTGNFYQPFTPFGESLVSASIDLSFGQRNLPRPYDTLAAWPGSLLDLVREHASTVS